MKHFGLTVIIFLSFLTEQSLFAQTSSDGKSSEIFKTETNLLNLNESDWAIYEDEETHTFYIDFEKIKTNLSALVVTSVKGETVFKDDLWNLPVNTIYELDMANYPNGEYDIEIRSFTSSIHKKVAVKNSCK